MPIIGLTDAASVVPQFPRLGKLRKGGEAVEKSRADGSTYRGYGPDLDYFRFTGERPGVQEAFLAACGPEPRELRVFLPHATMDDNFPSWWEKWSAQGLAARGDGVNITQWRTADGKYSFQPLPMPAGFEQDKDWRRIGRLTLILPALIKAGFVGYVTLDISAIHDFIAITGTLAQTLAMRDSLQGVEFVLRRQWEEIATPRSRGQRAMVKKSLVKIEPAPTWVAMQIAISERAALGAPETRLQIADGRTIDSSTGEILNEAPPAFEDDEEPGEFHSLNPAPAQPTTLPAQAPAATSGGGEQQPVCPICGGPMWDNREKIAATSKKMPEWSCKAGKWNATTKQKEGCQGVLWPGEFKPQANGGGAAKISQAQVAELGAYIKAVYGTDPAELAKVKTYMQGRFGVDDRAKLTAAQADEFAAILIGMLNNLTGAGQPELIPGEPAPAVSPYEEVVPF